MLFDFSEATQHEGEKVSELYKAYVMRLREVRDVDYLV